MKKLYSLFALFLMIGSSFVLVACGKNPTPIKKIDFEPNNGSAVITIQYDVATDSMIPPNPTKDGFAFDGWFWDNDVWSKPFTINSILDQPLQENMNLKVYAKWNNRNAIIFNANGGSGTMANQVIAEGTIAQLTANRFTRANWSFDGWATNSSGSVVYSNQAAFDMSANGGITLYAKWSQILTTVTFNKNDGTSDSYNQQIQINTDANLTANTFTRTGYSFIGWSTSSSSSVVHSNSALVNINANLSLYAVWQVNTYSVTYNSNYGQTQTTQQNDIQYGASVTLFGQSTFSREPFSLIKWNTQANGNGIDYALDHQLNYTLTNNLTLYAVWQLREHENGNGTEFSPFTFAYAEQLINFADKVNIVNNYSLGKYYALESNIDLGGIHWTPIGYYISSTDFTRAFQGNFNGRGFTISNYVIKVTYTNNRADIGLFGYAYNAEIKNLGVLGFSTQQTIGNELNAGGLIGCSHFTLTTKCYSSGNIDVMARLTANIGGLIGYNNRGDVENCYSTANVTINLSHNSISNYGNSYAGGLVGYTAADFSTYLGGVIRNSYATGNVYSSATTSNTSNFYCASSYAGGLAGSNGYAEIINSFATGNITSICSPAPASSSYSANGGGLLGRHMSTSNGGSTLYSGFLTNVYSFESQTIYRKLNNTVYNTPSKTYATVGVCTLSQINSANFYTSTLLWSNSIWSVVNGQLPILN